MIAKKRTAWLPTASIRPARPRRSCIVPCPPAPSAPKSVPTLAAAAQRHISRARGYRAQPRQRELDQVSCDLRRRLGVDVHLWQHSLEFLSIDQ
jgi:hypothetical protein